MGESPIYTANSILRRSGSYIPLIQVDPVQASPSLRRPGRSADPRRRCGRFPRICSGCLPRFCRARRTWRSGRSAGSGAAGPALSGPPLPDFQAQGEIAVAGPGGQPEVRLIPFNGQAQLLFRSRANGKTRFDRKLCAIHR